MVRHEMAVKADGLTMTGGKPFDQPMGLQGARLKVSVVPGKGRKPKAGIREKSENRIPNDPPGPCEKTAPDPGVRTSEFGLLSRFEFRALGLEPLLWPTRLIAPVAAPGRDSVSENA